MNKRFGTCKHCQQHSLAGSLYASSSTLVPIATHRFLVWLMCSNSFWRHHNETVRTVTMLINMILLKPSMSLCGCSRRPGSSRGYPEERGQWLMRCGKCLLQKHKPMESLFPSPELWGCAPLLLPDWLEHILIEHVNTHTHNHTRFFQFHSGFFST